MLADFSLTETRSADAHVVAVAGEIDLYTAPEVRTALVAAIERGARRLVVDLSDTGFLDSTGLGVLLTAARSLRSRGGAMAIVNSDDAIARTFAITGIDQILVVRASHEDALEALRSDTDGALPA